MKIIFIDNHDNGDHCSHFPLRHHDNIHDNVSHNNVYVIVIFMITIPVMTTIFMILKIICLDNDGDDDDNG